MLWIALHYRLDAAIFALIAIAVTWFIHRRIQRKYAANGLPLRAWLMLGVLLVVGVVLSELNAARDLNHLRGMLDGYAPTYAREIERLDHASLADHPDENDPVFLNLIYSQLRWQRANPSVADIYTIRRNPDGTPYFLVDSETDYDRDGRFDDDVEARTQPGEVVETDRLFIDDAFKGQSVFSDQPIRDRWGVWVSAYTPIYAPDGHIEAVLGVDYEASKWVTSLFWSRVSALGIVAMVIVMETAAGCLVYLTRTELRQRIKAEQLARASADQLREILDAEPESVAVFNRDGRVMQVNPAGLVMQEVQSLAELQAIDTFSQIDAEYREAYKKLHNETFAGKGGRLRFSMRSGKGNLRWMDKQTVPLRNEAGEIHSILSIGRDVTAHVQADNERQHLQRLLIDQLRNEAMEDKLTALPNRRLFVERLAEALAKTNAETDHFAAVLFLDFDRFKVINDSLGHEIGDLLLKDIAQRLRLMLVEDPCPGTKLAARLGGDEFTILLDGIARADDAADFAERLLKRLAQPYSLKGNDVHTTASIGITTTHVDYHGTDEILRDADTAMYKAKVAGRGRHVLFDRHMHDEAVARLTMESDLRRAIEREQLFLLYQPIVSLESGDTVGFEALVRWKLSDGSIVSPADFIPLAEEIGQIVPIGLWVLRTACRQMADWQRQCPDMAGVSISVNVSRKQLSSPELIGQIRQILTETGLAPAHLKLEITESIMMEDPDLWQQVLDQIRDMGIALHMDDFGTGYSSLSCLHNFPIDAVKIDRAFISNVGDRRDYAAVVQAIISLAHNLDMNLVAEGVERADQVAMLQTLGCDLAQGYFFAKPLTPEQAQAYIARPRAALAA